MAYASESSRPRFPYLGANIIDESTGKIVDFAIPYVGDSTPRGERGGS